MTHTRWIRGSGAALLIALAGLANIYVLGGWWARGRYAAALEDPQALLRAFIHSSDSIRRHQKPGGYWETPVTPDPAFARPRPEVNVFTPAVIVDLLEPVAAETGLGDVLERARGYLRRQIEPTGLVRYHGDPGAVDDSRRGCELPPDADDTALIWRLAPANDAGLLRSALRGLEQYRTAEGLYLTWMADRKAYRCFYDTFFPQDSNPPDVGIQMHLYLFFAKHDPGSARALCQALRGRIAEDRIWVWYRVAPLLPLLREGQLARAGCVVRVPESHLERALPGQEAYMAAGRLFRDLSLGGDSRPLREAVLRALRGLAARRFARLSEAPPLLYHNALSASPPHYHWSEDVGYAVWLRLYVETARRWPGSLPLPRAP